MHEKNVQDTSCSGGKGVSWYHVEIYFYQQIGARVSFSFSIICILIVEHSRTFLIFSSVCLASVDTLTGYCLLR